jgi:hypothetical protein
MGAYLYIWLDGFLSSGDILDWEKGVQKRVHRWSFGKIEGKYLGWSKTSNAFIIPMNSLLSLDHLLAHSKFSVSLLLPALDHLLATLVNSQGEKYVVHIYSRGSTSLLPPFCELNSLMIFVAGQIGGTSGAYVR